MSSFRHLDGMTALLSEINATVRAYIPNKGWHYHDRVIKVGVKK